MASPHGAGSCPVYGAKTWAFPGVQYVFDIDTLPAAAAFDHHLRRPPQRMSSAGRYTAVAVGAGFTGLEISTALGERLRTIADTHDAGGEVRVTLVDRADVIGPELGEGPRPNIDEAVDELKIERRPGKTVTSVTADEVTFSDGEVIPAGRCARHGGLGPHGPDDR
nr:FAD-dependent oxidoreductase [Streptomyces sp. SID8377]